MSPEQAEGDLEHLGPRSDVYSLGATLYYLLTGKPPFDGEVAEVILKVQQGQFPPPRQVDPRIDPALEAVCLKAMALKQAKHSYGRVIELLTPVIQGPYAWYWFRLYVSEAHRGLGMIAREQKEKSAAKEFAAAERIARGVLKDEPGSDPRESLARTLVVGWTGLATETNRAGEADAALDEAVALLDRITDESPAVTWYRLDRAEALLARGSRRAATGRAELAERDLNEARLILEELAAKERENRTYPGHLGRVALALGRLRLRQARAADARREFAQAVRHLERACQARPDHVLDRRSLEEARGALRQVGGAAGPAGRIPSDPPDRPVSR
jgi:serine/threonine protein kinase